MVEHKAHIADYKKKLVTKFAKLMTDHAIVCVLNMEHLPAAQLGKMRKQLREKGTIIMTKKRLINLSIDVAKENKKGLEDLKNYLNGMPALMFTNENPFAIFKTIKKSKSKAAAKPGDIAPDDIIIKAGPTQFTPGPIISEFGNLGIKTKIEEGKINILSDKVAAKAGEEISPGLASMLSKLGIEPMEIGLDFVAAYEDGIIYKRDVLNIDEDEFLGKISNAANWAINLSVEANYVTKDNANIIISKAFRQAKAIVTEANIYTPDFINEILTKAERQMLGLADNAKIDLTKTEPAKKETTAPEEKKEEAPAEEKAENNTTTDSPQKEEKEPSTEEKVEKMVEEVKNKSEGDKVSAEEIVNKVVEEEK